jgi:PEP-CTERM motif
VRRFLLLLLLAVVIACAPNCLADSVLSSTCPNPRCQVHPEWAGSGIHEHFDRSDVQKRVHRDVDQASAFPYPVNRRHSRSLARRDYQLMPWDYLIAGTTNPAGTGGVWSAAGTFSADNAATLQSVLLDAQDLNVLSSYPQGSYCFPYAGPASSDGYLAITTTANFSQSNHSLSVPTARSPRVDFTDSGQHQPQSTVTPEPSNLVLFGAGMLGIIFVMRKRLVGSPSRGVPAEDSFC